MDSAHQDRHRPSAVIVPVQFLRGIAASFVVAAHLLERLVKRDVFPNGLPDWVDSFGAMGVATFFAISGFIMVYTTAHEFGSPNAGIYFFKRRFFRVAPIYYLTTILMIAFIYGTFSFSTNKAYIQPTLSQLVMSAFFVPYIDESALAHPVYGLGWTLEYEMFFYAVFAVALTLPKRTGLASAIGFLTCLVAAGTLIPAPQPIVGLPVPLYYFTRPLLLYFVCGMGIALVRLTWGTVKTPAPPWVISVIALTALGIGIRFVPVDISFGSALSVTTAVGVATLLQSSQIRITRFDTLSRAFGDASYSMYLTHSFFLGAIAIVFSRLAATGTMATIVLIITTCLFCAVPAWLVWRFVEMPLTRMSRAKPPAPITGPA